MANLLFDKFHELAKQVVKWNMNVYGSLHINVELARQNLIDAHTTFNFDPSLHNKAHEAHCLQI